VASRVGAPERVFEGLGERADQESDAEVAARVVDALQSIADLHRGETVLVLASPTLVSLAVPGLADSAEDVDGPGDWRGFAEIRVDADAWTLRRWSWTPTAKPGRNT
jgi:broad specificity phosphatase PhoE